MPTPRIKLQQLFVVAGCLLLAAVAAAAEPQVVKVIWDGAAPQGKPYVSADMTWTDAGKDGARSVWRLAGKPKDPASNSWVSLYLDEAQDWSTGTALVLTVRGTAGQRWICEINDDLPIERFVHEFTIAGDGWQEVRLVLADFSRRKNQDAKALDDGLGLVRMHGFGLISVTGAASIDLARAVVVK